MQVFREKIFVANLRNLNEVFEAFTKKESWYDFRII